MGLLRDALNLGYITLEQYEEMSDEWSDIGYEARHYGNVEALEDMISDFLDLGFLDLAEAAATDYFEAIDYYEEAYGYSIYYNTADNRWHDSETHRYVKDPYEWIRD
jgi:hypothetical protein